MNRSVLQLDDLAQSYGVQTEYEDVHQRRQVATSDSILAVLTALGVPVNKMSDVPEAVEQRRHELANQMIAPALVAWEGQFNQIRMRLPKTHQGMSVNFVCELEDGESIHWSSIQMTEIDEEILGDHLTRSVRVEFTAQALPPGYHQLRVETAGAHGDALLISAPVTTYSPVSPEAAASSRRWGLFVPAYALHSSQSWGAGNIRDLETLWNWTASLGGSMVATLPLLATYLETPCDFSPYSPASRLFWNEFYIDVESVPELEQTPHVQEIIQSTQFAEEVAALRRERLVDYQTQMRLKRRLLEELSRCCFEGSNSRTAALDQFIATRPDIENYAAFRATAERRQELWHNWPDRLHSGHLSPTDYGESAWRYHVYVQWIAQQQIDRLSATSRKSGSGLYLDLPLGVHRSGYDTWRHRESFALDASGGAPPDAFFTKGQDWGFAPLHPERLRQQRYRYFIEVIQTNFKHCDMLRIDHVMQLHRLFWVPMGMEAKEGVYVRYPAEELYAIVCLESHRQRCVVVGENLGTVPSYVNDAMKSHHMRQMYVAQYENNANQHPPLPAVPRNCVASVNTHDTATFAAYWNESDLDLLHELELFNDEEIEIERLDRQRNRFALEAFLREQGFLDEEEQATTQNLLDSLHAFLANSPAEMVLISLEDLWLETAPQNTPGTGTERPNWRRKTRYRLEQIMETPEFTERLRQITRLRNKAIHT